MTSQTENFGGAADPKKPEVLSAQQYFNLLELLVVEGEGIGKTSNVTAFKLPEITVETLTDTGEHETTNTIAFKKDVYILLDREKWPKANELAVNAAIEDLGKNWGKKTVQINRAGEGLGGTESDIETAVAEKVKTLMGVADLSKAGVYVSTANNFEDDYAPTAPGSTDYQPNPDGKRVALTVTEDIVLPVSWYPGATFDVAKGGTIVTRERKQKDGENVGQFPELAAAIASVRNGTATIEEAIYDDKGVPKFDVWGLHPGFKEANYGDVELSGDVHIIQDLAYLKRDRNLGGLDL